jgi:hypothetical protein
VTSDPPGQPVRFDGERVGATPVAVEANTPWALHRVEVGEGPEAVTRVVVANQTFSRDAASFFLMPVSCLCLLPAIATAGTEDRIHVITSLAGEPLGTIPGAQVDLEYLPPHRRYPANTRTQAFVVDGQRVRVMVDRRPFAFSINYMGLSFGEAPTRLNPPGGSPTRSSRPVFSFGIEQEWSPTPRTALAATAGYRGWIGALENGTIVSRRGRPNSPAVGFDEYRAGALARYRLPLARVDGAMGGLDATGAVGGYYAVQLFYSPLGGHRQVAVLPFFEAGLDAQITRPVVVFATLRGYPAGAPEPGGIWGNLGAGRELQFILGARILH